MNALITSIPAAEPVDSPREIAGPTRADAELNRRLVTGIAGAAGIALLASRAFAGPLDPPPGPITASTKPLSEIEPRTAINAANTPGDATAVFVISQPGSYYLTANLTVPAGKAGIRVAASDVRVDLNGFVLSGNAAAGTSGITDSGVALTDISVHDGVIRAMSGIGVNLGATRRSLIDELRVHDNAGTGVLTGHAARITGVRADVNAATQGAGAAGIRSGDASQILRCTAKGNTGVGIVVGTDALVESCIASQNTGNGIEGFSYGKVLRCIAYDNGGHGIVSASVVGSCNSSDNTLRGIYVSSASVEGCAARSNGAHGISAGASTVTECTSALSISAGNSAHGYDLGASSNLTDSTAYNNAGHGISASQSSRIEGCTSRRNAILGIAVAGSCSVVENNCSDNITGIQVAGASNRIEGNLCGGGTNFGIQVVAAYNLIVRNTCSSNVINWSIYFNCPYGPVVDRTNPAVSGMSGNGTVASTMASTDFHANFSL